MPTFIVEIEKFYSKEAIEERQERWREEKELEFIDFLLENYNKIGRNEPCPCGSGKKFKKCHLPIIEAKRRELAETRERLNKLMENAAVISVLKETEMKMRQILAKQDKAYLFKEIEKNIIEAARASNEEFIERGMSYYLQPIFDKLEFQNENEAEEFSGFLMDYWNAIIYLYKGFGDYSH
ncbi:MAG: SEC-C domain-containing protein [Deltaproteobacteria bacterium]|nr:SEC-C domain-containing protein [Deltaproteobacteria bacterium]